MKIEEIYHKTVLNTIKKYNIDIEPFENYGELRAYIKKNLRRFYQRYHAEKYRNYMRERYHIKKNEKVSLSHN